MTRTREERRIIDDALAWWRDLRPNDWTYERHLEEPTVNAISDEEKALARACARYTKAGLHQSVEQKKEGG